MIVVCDVCWCNGASKNVHNIPHTSPPPPHNQSYHQPTHQSHNPTTNHTRYAAAVVRNVSNTTVDLGGSTTLSGRRLLGLCVLLLRDTSAAATGCGGAGGDVEAGSC